MGKRSSFKRKSRDFYPTPATAVHPLASYVSRNGFPLTFYEPCCGDGSLIEHLEGVSLCVGMSDVEPRCAGAVKYDALGEHIRGMVVSTGADAIITNTPWASPNGRGEPALSFIRLFSSIRPSWMLFPADMAHNVYFRDVSRMCVTILSIGRVSWEGNGVGGKENAAWYLFDATHDGPIEFIPR